MDDFDQMWNPKSKRKDDKEELPYLPPLPSMSTQPTITISIGQPAPAIDPCLLGGFEEDDEFTSDPDDYSKPNPSRALKALLGKG